MYQNFFFGPFSKIPQVFEVFRLFPVTNSIPKLLHEASIISYQISNSPKFIFSHSKLDLNISRLLQEFDSVRFCLFECLKLSKKSKEGGSPAKAR